MLKSAHFAIMCASKTNLNMTKIAILASGSGSNAENIINHFSNIKDVSIEVIISNKPDAYVHARAEKLNIPSATFSKAEFDSSEIVLDFMKEKEIDFVILAGFLLKIPKNIILTYPNKIINIHPALLPKFGGKGMYGDNVHRAVIEAQEKESGITIHFVNENYDEGAIIFQAKCEVNSEDTYESLAQKIHALEYENFPQIIERVLNQLI